MEETVDVLKRDGKSFGESYTSSVLKFVLNCIKLPVALIVLLPISLVSNLFVLKPKDKRALEDLATRYAKLEGVEIIPLQSRKYDIILFGSTGFTGKLAAIYAAKNYGTSGLRWAIAGRSKSKLAALRDELVKITGNTALRSLDLIIADTADEPSLENLVKDTKVIVSTVGPFAKYGTPLVKYCVAFGTSYADTTGEVAWVRQLIAYYQEQAAATGAKIINLCGNDCIPWDLMAYLLNKKLHAESPHPDEELASLELYDEMKGGFSGGTLATIIYNLSNKVGPNHKFDPLYTLPDGSKSRCKLTSKISFTPGHSKTRRSWYSFFVLALGNMDCVKRSNALYGYGKKVTYKEQLVEPNMFAAMNATIDLIVLGIMLSSPFLRNLLFSAGVLPQPGDGPSQETRNSGFLKVKGFAKGTRGTKVNGWVYFPTDPGYNDTARMVVESGLCMALDNGNLPNIGGGIWSPAFALGDVLKERLEKTGTEWNM